MKKSKNILILGLLLILGVRIVSADSVKLKGPSEFSGDSFKVILELSSSKKIAGIEFPVTWDKNKLKIVSSFDENEDALHKELSIYDFTFPSEPGRVMLLDAAKTKTGTIEAAEIHITATDNFKVGESTTITLSEGMFADLEDNGWKVSGTSFTIKRIAENSNANGGTQTPESNNGGTQTPESNNGGTQTPESNKDGNENNSGESAPSKDNNIANPDTGMSVPTAILLVAIISAGVIYLKNKFAKKLYKL